MNFVFSVLVLITFDCLRLLLIWKAQSSVLVLARQNPLDHLRVHLGDQVRLRLRPCLLLLPPPARCCFFFGTSFNEILLLLGTFLPPLNGASPVCCPPKVARTSFMDMFGQCLERGKQAHLFWNFNVRDVRAYALVPRKATCSDAHVLSAIVTATHLVGKRETLWVKTRKKVLPFPSFPPIHRLKWIDS